MTQGQQELPSKVIGFKGFEKNRPRSATLGQKQVEATEGFGYDPEHYIRDGQGKAKASQRGPRRRSGKSGN